jgi:polyribonucleotide nucleotidyltransferase
VCCAVPGLPKLYNICKSSTPCFFIFRRDGTRNVLYTRREQPQHHLTRLVWTFVGAPVTFGRTDPGEVRRIAQFGAFFKMIGFEKDGLIHISQLANARVEDVRTQPASCGSTAHHAQSTRWHLSFPLRVLHLINKNKVTHAIESQRFGLSRDGWTN